MIIGRPPSRPIDLTDTKVLCDRHTNLDRAIARIQGFALSSDFPIEEAKLVKLVVKNEIERRRRQGDQVAEAYAQKRGWQAPQGAVLEAVK